MSRVLVIARENPQRAWLCELLARSGYAAVARNSTADFRASGDWSLYDIIVLELQPAHTDGDHTLATYVQRFRPGIVMLDRRWSPEAICRAVDRRQQERTAQRGTRRKRTDYYGSPAELAAVERLVLESASIPAPRDALIAAVRAGGFQRWSGRMVKYVLRRLEEKAELVADAVTGRYQLTETGLARMERARRAARHVS